MLQFFFVFLKDTIFFFIVVLFFLSYTLYISIFQSKSKYNKRIMLQHCFIIIIRLNNSHLTFMFVKKFLYVVCIEMKVSQNQLENIRLYSHIFEFLLRNSLKVCNLRDNLYKKVAGIYIYRWDFKSWSIYIIEICVTFSNHHLRLYT